MATFTYEQLLAVFIIFMTALVIYFKWSYKYWERRNIPQLKPSLPFGNLQPPFLSKRGLLDQVQQIYKELKSKGLKHGGFYIINSPIYMPVDLDLVRNVLVKDFQHFVDRGFYHNAKADPLSAHLFSIEGQKWKNLRAKLTPTFTSGKMKMMFQTVLDCGAELTQEIDRCSGEKIPLDIKELAACYTTDVICSCAFGVEVKSLKDSNSDFRKYGRKVFTPTLDLMVRSFVTLIFPKVCKSFGVRFFPRDVTKFFMSAIANIVDYRENKSVFRNDFVQLLIEIKNKEMDDEKITIEEMGAQAFLFFLAGFETSSSAMTFCLYELARNHDIQDKLREEIVRVLAKHNGEINYDSVMEMKYLTQVIEETLRMYPPVRTLDRICTEPYKIPGTDAELETGTKLFIPVRAIHYDPQHYPNPRKFNPHNFSPENKANRHPLAYLPFGEGPRHCIGLRFGLMQTKIGLVSMLRDYKYTLNPKTPAKLTFSSKTIVMNALDDILLDVVKVK